MCALAVLTMLALHNPPRWTVVMIPRSEITGRRYTKRDFAREKACCRSRGITCRVAEG